MKRLNKRELQSLLKEVSAEIKEIKRDIKAEEKSNEFSRKVDRLYDRLEGNELLLDALDMAISNISSRLDDKGWEAVIDDFKNAVEFADNNKASFSSRDVLDRVLISDTNENKKECTMIRRTSKPVSRQTRRFESRGIRRRFNEAEESNVFYKASNASFEVFEDDPEYGMGDYVNGYDLPCSCTAKTLEELFNKVKSKLYMDDKDFYWMIDRDSSSFRVSYTGNNDSEVASEYEIAAWKKGKEQLYIIDGFISVQKVMGEIDVPEDEMEELARKTNTELN